MGMEYEAWPTKVDELVKATGLPTEHFDVRSRIPWPPKQRRSIPSPPVRSCRSFSLRVHRGNSDLFVHWGLSILTVAQERTKQKKKWGQIGDRIELYLEP